MAQNILVGLIYSTRRNHYDLKKVVPCFHFRYSILCKRTKNWFSNQLQGRMEFMVFFVLNFWSCWVIPEPIKDTSSSSQGRCEQGDRVAHPSLPFLVFQYENKRNFGDLEPSKLQLQNTFHKSFFFELSSRSVGDGSPFVNFVVWNEA